MRCIKNTATDERLWALIFFDNILNLLSKKVSVAARPLWTLG